MVLPIYIIAGRLWPLLVACGIFYVILLVACGTFYVILLVTCGTSYIYHCWSLVAIAGRLWYFLCNIAGRLWYFLYISLLVTCSFSYIYSIAGRLWPLLVACTIFFLILLVACGTSYIYHCWSLVAIAGRLWYFLCNIAGRLWYFLYTWVSWVDNPGDWLMYLFLLSGVLVGCLLSSSQLQAILSLPCGHLHLGVVHLDGLMHLFFCAVPGRLIGHNGG